jgi:hypothetical protein
MFVRQKLGILLTVVLAAASAGCDPGYEYKPVNENGNPVEEQSAKIGEVSFTLHAYSILIGSQNDWVELTIENKSADEVEVVGAELTTGGRTVAANLWPGPDGREERTVPARSKKKVSLLVELGGHAADVLAPSIVDVWRVRIGTAEHTLRFELRRK